MRELRASAVALVVMSLVLGLAYPLAMAAVGRSADPSLIGKDFSRDLADFQSRPSATKYSATATFFNNQGPNQRELTAMLKTNARAYLKRERPTTPGLRVAAIPADAVTTSASGVDPDLSVANARIQANRVARRRGIGRARVLALIDAHTSRALLGLGGAGSVNVRDLNRALPR
jgi:K+-transporting ATPase ATPase C chain